MKNKIKFLVLLILNQIISGNVLKCGNGLLKHKEPGIIDDIPNKRVLAESDWEPIKIYVDYTQLKIDTKDYPDIFNIMKDSLDSAVHYYESLIMVKPTSIEKMTSDNYAKECDIDNVDKNISNFYQNYSLMLFPSFKYDDPIPNVYASAYSCLVLSSSKRPCAGRIFIENNIDFKKNNIKIFLQTILFHEIAHIFVFDPHLLSNLKMIRTVYKDDEAIPMVVSQKVLEKARLHFNCDTLEGLALENQGGEGSAGSHWESRYMLGDFMVSNNYLENVISDITLALFEDSGWYKVNYYTGGLFRFGKNEGCSFFERKCIEDKKSVFPKEFCDKKMEPRCLNSHLGMGECYIQEYEKGEIPSKYQYFNDEKKGGLFNVEFCPVADLYFNADKDNSYFESNCRYGESLNIFNHYGEVIGNKSICFESSLVPRYSPLPYKWRSICYPIECDRKNKKIIVHVNDLSVECPTKGGMLKKIKGFKGKINCPEYDLICTSDIWCNEMFECIDKKSITDEKTYIANNSVDDL